MTFQRRIDFFLLQKLYTFIAKRFLKCQSYKRKTKISPKSLYPEVYIVFLSPQIYIPFHSLSVNTYEIGSVFCIFLTVAGFNQNTANYFKEVCVLHVGL